MKFYQLLALYLAFLVACQAFSIQGLFKATQSSDYYSTEQSLKAVESWIQLKNIRRSQNGTGNNLANPSWGAFHTNVLRKTTPLYSDGKQKILQGRPNTRFISNAVVQISEIIQDPNGLSMIFPVWGQFLDHDMTLVPQQQARNWSNIEYIATQIPRCDLFFDPECKGDIKQNIINRAIYDKNQTIRTPINQQTAFIDGSQIYGSTDEISSKLRSFSRGKMISLPGGLLPQDQNGFHISGDQRVDFSGPLTCLHTLFLREHNRIADLVYGFNSSLTDQQIYQIGRNYVIGLLQKISFYDYLPKLFGKEYFDKNVGPFNAYNPKTNPSIFIEFSGAAYRYGHPMMNQYYNLVNNNNKVVQVLNLTDMSFRPDRVTYLFVSQILKGLPFTYAKVRSTQYAHSLRDALLQIPGISVKSDLFVANTQRGRDLGLQDYNTLRKVYGLSPYTNFSQLFQDEEDARLLEKAYLNINNVDPYLGVIAQKSLPGGAIGQLAGKVLQQQFKNLRQGDRFWFQNAYPAQIVAEIKATSLSDIVKRNTDISQMPVDPFMYIKL